MLVPKKLWYYDGCKLDAKKYKSKYTISQENIPGNKYSIILKSITT